jgi:hypothetical protein
VSFDFQNSLPWSNRPHDPGVKVPEAFQDLGDELRSYHHSICTKSESG